MAPEPTDNWKSGDPIGYIRDDIPEFDVPAYEGERYEAPVPDTLDLEERAALAVNGLTSPTDPLADHEMYSTVFFRRSPPMMQHDYSDHCQVKFMEALPLMRIISGSDLNSEVDRSWMSAALRMQGPDGLIYTPVKGRPWAFLETVGCVPPGSNTDVDQYIDAEMGGRMLTSFMLYYRRSKDPLWKEVAERVVDGLVDLAVDRGDYAYYAPSPHFAIKGSTDEYGKRVPLFGMGVEYIILGLSHLFRETGYEPAEKLAQKLIRYALHELNAFDEAGHFLPGDRPEQMHLGADFHQHSYVLLALLEYALLTDNAEYLEFVRKGFEYGKANSDIVLGYFPENIGSTEMEQSPICDVADMIALGLKLTRAGVGDYWEEVDCWIRNMFAEGQLLPSRAQWLESYALQFPAIEPNPMHQTTDRVLERNVGAFASWPTPNDWYVGRAPEEHGIIHCCTGNGTRAIYFAWEHILDFDDGKLRVNLLLNRSSPWAELDSCIPYTGQVDINIKEPVNLSVRIPEWVNKDDVRLKVNEKERKFRWDGRYALAGDVKPQEIVTFTFPITERSETLWIEKERYNIVRKGNDVVAIDPPGQVCPLYQRDHYRENKTRFKKRERFVSKELIYQ